MIEKEPTLIENEAKKDDVSEITLKEGGNYMEASLTALATLHCLLSLSMLISYYRLKVEIV